MKLNEYIKKMRMTKKDFSVDSGIPLSTVNKYAFGTRIPRKEHMDIIVKETKGEVTPNDFYDSQV